ncbi:hypothetical protein KRX56_01400 [Dermabacteraceae bacterium TAE3-ERU27]|nr:hypothetical protein [Dermabacteraceae bacterium TAE3-ERU27]
MQPPQENPGQQISLPDHNAANAAVTPAPQRHDGTHRTVLAILVGGSVLVLALLLILWLTFFRGQDTDVSALRGQPLNTEPVHSGQEYTPPPDNPDETPPPPIFTTAPTKPCYIPDDQESLGAREGTVQVGRLRATFPRFFDTGWSQSVGYMQRSFSSAALIEGNWYSAVTVGTVAWEPGEQFPGDKAAAEAIFQCYATSAGVYEEFGDDSLVTDYSSKAITVDGHPAWQVQAVYNFNSARLTTTSSSVVTAIVIDTGDGQHAALASDVAADVPGHREALNEVIARLKVV